MLFMLLLIGIKKKSVEYLIDCVEVKIQKCSRSIRPTYTG